jgi:acetolactate synthase-1/2/3 large subunit
LLCAAQRRTAQALSLLFLLLCAGRAAANPEPARQTAATALVHYLEKEGVTKVFGVPGEETLHLIDALRQSKKIEFVLAANEQGASFMATGYARATGKLGVALSTLGPGATNLVTGAATALSENVKLLLITGQGPVKRPIGYHQKLDLTGLFSSVTRLSLEPHRAGSVVAAARKLIAAANRTPGPVHLSLPADLAGREIAVRGEPARAARARRPRPDATATAHAAELIRGAKLPVIIAGDGVLQEQASHTARGVLAFARAHGIPIVPSAIAKGMFPSDNELTVPPLDAFAKGKGADLIRKADLIISVGYHPTETFEPTAFNPRGKTRIVHLSAEKLPTEHRIPGMTPEVEITSGLVKGLGALHRALGKFRAPATALQAARETRSQHAADLARYTANRNAEAPLKPQQIMGELRRALDGPDTTRKSPTMVFGDVGLNKGFLTQWLPVNRPGEVMVPNGLSTMGVALPSAVGAKIARPELRVVSVSGDGGLMMNVQELATAAKQKLPLVHLVLIDKRLGLIENHQRRNNLTPSGVDLGGLDVVALARGMGARGVMVKRASQIAPLVQRALKAKGPTLIGIPVDYSEAQAAADKLGQALRASKTRGRARR